MSTPEVHFRAHERREVRLTVEVTGPRPGTGRQAVVVDMSLAGAGLETEGGPLVPGERLSVKLATPTMWDPLLVSAIVAWAHPPRALHGVDALGRPRRAVARAGIVFEYANPSAVLAMFEMLATLGYG